MKRIIFTLLFAALMAPAGLHAQRVYKDLGAGGRVILDLTTAAGMPAGAQTAVSKTAVLNAVTASNTTGPLAGNIYSGTINATVYQKLEIAPYDINTAGQISATGTFTMNWADAYNRCKAANYNGTGWRLPTQREFMLIYIYNKDALTPLGVGGFSLAFYWCATEDFPTTAWDVGSDGGVNKSTKITTNNHGARCVREVTP